MTSEFDLRTSILPNIMEAVGNTPCVRLNKFPGLVGLKCEVIAKCEFMNPGGSVKDRIGVRMVQEAIKESRIKPGDTMIEPTSGNTGLGMAMAAASTGHKMIITMPEKMSQEKIIVLKALGAEIVRTPTEAAYNDPTSHISVAEDIRKTNPENFHILDQYKNVNNPNAHYYGTGPEILKQCGGKVDMLVMGVGTGGTITGVAKYFKEHSPHTIVVGVDPVGSLLADPENDKLGGYQVEGIGYDFIPDVLDRSLVNKWYKSTDKEGFNLARMVHRNEGILCGGSSGAALQAVKNVASTLTADQRCVVVLPDGVRNYLTKFLDDEWMIHNNFMEGESKRPPVDVILNEYSGMKKRIQELEEQLKNAGK